MVGSYAKQKKNEMNCSPIPGPIVILNKEMGAQCKGSPSVELGIRLRDPQREPSSADCPRVERDCRT